MAETRARQPLHPDFLLLVPKCSCTALRPALLRGGGEVTSLDLLRSRTNLPSSSTSSTATRPLVRACCEKLLRLSVASSLRFLVMLPPL